MHSIGISHLASRADLVIFRLFSFIMATMPIVGHGIDIVETARIRHMAEVHGEHFLNRVFTPAEQRYCTARLKRLYEHLAGRFAAKEAVLKVLGTGWAGGIAWCDMEILPDANGRPVLTLAGQSLIVADKLGITQWHITISHIETHAVGSAIGTREPAR